MFDIDYSTWRMVNALGSMVGAMVLIVIAVLLLHRGLSEKVRLNLIPGRLILGSYLLVFALITLEEAAWKLYLFDSKPGTVGRHTNDWNTVLMLFAVIVLGVHSLIRLKRNTLGDQSAVD